MGWLVILGSIPIGVLGLLFESQIDHSLRNLYITASMLILFGILLGFADRFAPQRKELTELSVRDGILFGLAMDYQVFLVTRMREAHVHGMTTREAVVDGFRNSARVVTAAATIMIAVFAAFMLQDLAIIKSIGFALAAAIVFDAFIVRLVLIPALLFLMGEKAWWLPKWLDRLLPNVDVEGESLERDSTPGRRTELADAGV